MLAVTTNHILLSNNHEINTTYQAFYSRKIDTDWKVRYLEYHWNVAASRAVDVSLSISNT